MSRSPRRRDRIPRSPAQSRARIFQGLGRRSADGSPGEGQGTTPAEALTATDAAAAEPSIHVIAYGPDGLEEKDVADCTDIAAFLQRWPVTWVDVAGLGDEATVEAIARVFGLHGLAVEDVLRTHQRPKLEPYGTHAFLVLRMMEMRETIESEQVSVFLGRNFVVTFQEDRPGDCFQDVRRRLRSGAASLRQRGADRLVHALADAVVDACFPVLESIGDRIEELEAEIVADPDAVRVEAIMALKRELLTLRRIAWPTRDALGALYRDDVPGVSAETRPYLRDVHDHAVQVLDLVEAYREVGSGLMEVYLSSVSNRLNEVMKVLTIIATIFIPLSFIASVYGMNFEHMPELGWLHGYPFALAIMGVVGFGLLGWFWRRGWLTRRRPARAPRGPVPSVPAEPRRAPQGPRP